MKSIKAILLVFALSVFVYADGNMDNGKGGSPPPPGGFAANMPNGKTGDMNNGRIAAGAPLTVAALNLLKSLTYLY